jgi:hypothetical protein
MAASGLTDVVEKPLRPIGFPAQCSENPQLFQRRKLSPINGPDIVTAKASVTEARKSLRSAADGNQIYRLAASWYRVSTSDVRQEQLAWPDGCFRP